MSGKSSLIPFKCTMDTKLRWFQYRILNRFLTKNYRFGLNYKTGSEVSLVSYLYWIKLIFFSGTDLNICNAAINLIILFTKFYIYRTRCQGSSLSFVSLQREMESYYKLEKYILSKNLNLSNLKTNGRCGKGFLIECFYYTIRLIY